MRVRLRAFVRFRARGRRHSCDVLSVYVRARPCANSLPATLNVNVERMHMSRHMRLNLFNFYVISANVRVTNGAQWRAPFFLFTLSLQTAYFYTRIVHIVVVAVVNAAENTSISPRHCENVRLCTSLLFFFFCCRFSSRFFFCAFPHVFARLLIFFTLRQKRSLFVNKKIVGTQSSKK